MPNLKPLSAPASGLAAAALAPNTRRAYRRAYRRALRDLDSWLGGRALGDAALADYCAAKHESRLAPASISAAVAAVKCTARLSPVGPLTARVLAGIRRAGAGRGRGQVMGLPWDAADLISTLAERDGTFAGLRDAALVSLWSDSMFRISESCAVRFEDIESQPDGSGLLKIRKSKTDQNARGTVHYIGAATMKKIAAWCATASIDGGPLFRRVLRGGHAQAGGLSAIAARNIIKDRAAKAGFDPARVSGHSLRIGAAQSLAAAGASLVELQTAGRWKSPAMPAHYARGQFAVRGAVARLRYGQG